MLCKHHDVKRHENVNGWEIDIFLKDVNVYIQFDGIYWHCLETPLDIFLSNPNKSKFRIVKTAINDAKQNVWFEANKKTLLRISERDYILISKLFNSIDVKTLSTLCYKKIHWDVYDLQ